MSGDANSQTFRNMSDRHKEETGETVYSGMDANGYYFTFGFFPKNKAAEAMEKFRELRESVPHVMVNGNRQCPENYCISAPHPDNRHVDYTGATWRTRKDGESYDVQGHDGE